MNGKHIYVVPAGEFVYFTHLRSLPIKIPLLPLFAALHLVSSRSEFAHHASVASSTSVHCLEGRGRRSVITCCEATETLPCDWLIGSFCERAIEAGTDA